jgi:hypothetical protein
VGYELNPLLALIAWLRTWRYRGQVRVVWGDFWTKKWPPHQAIFVFLLDSFMQKLDTKVIQASRESGHSIKLASFAFQIPGRKPKAEKDGLFLYEYK